MCQQPRSLFVHPLFIYFILSLLRSLQNQEYGCNWSLALYLCGLFNQGLRKIPQCISFLPNRTFQEVFFLPAAISNWGNLDNADAYIEYVFLSVCLHFWDCVLLSPWRLQISHFFLDVEVSETLPLSRSPIKASIDNDSLIQLGDFFYFLFLFFDFINTAKKKK